VLFNTVIKACSHAGDLQRAEYWRSRLIQEGLTPNLKGEGKMMHAASKSGNVAAAEKYLKMQDTSTLKDLQDQCISITQVINACANRGMPGRAELWLEKGVAAGVPIDSVCYTTVIHTWAKAGDADKATAWLKKAWDAVKATALSYSSALFACWRAVPPRPALAEQIFRQMMDNGGIRPDAGTGSLRNLRLAIGPDRFKALCHEMEVTEEEMENMLQKNDRLQDKVR